MNIGDKAPENLGKPYKHRNMMNRKSLLNLWLVTLTIFGLAVFSACSDDNNVVQKSGSDFRDTLKTLNWGTDTCFIYGHKTPDVDAVTSALSYAKLMRSLGYNCKAKVSSKMNRETAYISQLFGFDVPELKTSVVPQTRLILTDHGDYAQCVDGAREAIILQKIDHHTEGDIHDADVPYVRREMVGSTNTIIYEMYQELGVPIDRETAHIMLAGILSDTRNLSKSTTCGIDTIVWTALTSQLGLSADSVAKINYAMQEAASSYDGMKDIEIFESDYKNYDMKGHRVGIGSLEYKQSEMNAFMDRMLAVMPEVMAKNNLEMVFAKIDNMVPNPDPTQALSPYIQNGIYFIYYGEGTKEISEAIFGASQREGVTYTKEDLSRKQIVPKMEAVIK